MSWSLQYLEGSAWGSSLWLRSPRASTVSLVDSLLTKRARGEMANLTSSPDMYFPGLLKPPPFRGAKSPAPMRGTRATMKGTRASSTLPQTSRLQVARSMRMLWWVE